MKTGTDGVLLGAWAEGGRRILDIGTGTGLIALMMAQRFPLARVTGIDIETEACLDAEENAAASPFSPRIQILHRSLQDFDPEYDRFDCIVSNPPFFHNSMKNPDNKRCLARQADALDFASLMKGVERLLDDDGTASFIIPTDSFNDFYAEVCFSGLFLLRRCDVRTLPGKLPKRTLLTVGRNQFRPLETAVECLTDPYGNKSDWYRKITDGFYL